MKVSVAKEVQPYSILAADVYASKAGAGSTNFGYIRSSEDWKATLSKAGLSQAQIEQFEKSNFYASTYVNNAKREVAISYRGSESPALTVSSLRDWATNIGARYLPSDGRIVPTQYDAALAYAKAVQQTSQSSLSGYKITVVGHSEGGAEASYVGNKLGLETYTFNPARNAFSTQKSDAPHRQVNVNTISDFVGDADISKLSGRGLLPGTSVFVSPTGGADLPLDQRHTMENVEAGIGEFLLRAERK